MTAKLKSDASRQSRSPTLSSSSSRLIRKPHPSEVQRSPLDSLETFSDMSSSTAPMFEALDDVFDFPPPSNPQRPPSDNEGMDFDMDAEIAMMQEEEERDMKRRYGDSPPPNVEEEPDWEDDADSGIESSTMGTKSKTITSMDQIQHNRDAENLGREGGFGESDIFDFPIASCKSDLELP